MYKIVKRLELCVPSILINIGDSLRQEPVPTSSTPAPTCPLGKSSGPQPLTLKADLVGELF